MSLPASHPSAAVDSLGCTSSQLYKDQEIEGDGIRFYRKLSKSAISQVETPATDRGFLVGVSMLGGHRRAVFKGTQRGAEHFDKHDIYIRNFADSYRADLEGPFDFLLLELSQSVLDAASDPGDTGRTARLATASGLQDVVLSNLACALAPALDRPAETSRLFIDQMGLAIASHLVQRHGREHVRMAPRRAMLSRLQEARAKELLSERIDGDVSLEEIADACGVSRSHFFARSATRPARPRISGCSSRRSSGRSTCCAIPPWPSSRSPHGAASPTKVTSRGCSPAQRARRQVTGAMRSCRTSPGRRRAGLD